MKWFAACFALTLAGLGSAAPLQQAQGGGGGDNNGWKPVDESTNKAAAAASAAGRSFEAAASLQVDPNELHRRGDELYKHMDDADYWAQFTQPEEIKQRVNELMHSPRFLQRVSSTINSSAKQDNGPESKSIFGVELKKSTEDHVWREAFTSVFDEQSLFKNAAGDLVKAVLRVWGWISLDLALYQGNGIFKF